jgi:hypothetical protein
VLVQGELRAVRGAGLGERAEGFHEASQ